MAEIEFTVPEPKPEKVVEVPEEIAKEFEGCEVDRDAASAPTLLEAPPCLEVMLGAKPAIHPLPDDPVQVYHEIDSDPDALLRGLLAQGGDDGSLYRQSQIELHNANVTARNIERKARKAVAKRKQEEGRRRR
jgi:hypothetical protein